MMQAEMQNNPGVGASDAPAAAAPSRRASLKAFFAEKTKLKPRLVSHEDLAPGSYILTGGKIRDSRLFKFVASSERIMFESLTNTEISERLVGQWTAAGVIGALFGSIAYGALVTPLSDKAGDENILYGLCMSSAAALELSCAIIVTLLYMVLNSLPTPCGRAFLDYFLLLLPVPTVLMLAGCGAMLLGSMIIIKTEYSVAMYDLYCFTMPVCCAILFGMLWYVIRGAKMIARRQYVVACTSGGEGHVHNPAHPTEGGGGVDHSRSRPSFCRTCGQPRRENHSDTKFCEYCGKEL